jgi:hypothetical protein
MVMGGYFSRSDTLSVASAAMPLQTYNGLSGTAMLRTRSHKTETMLALLQELDCGCNAHGSCKRAEGVAGVRRVGLALPCEAMRGSKVPMGFSVLKSLRRGWAAEQPTLHQAGLRDGGGDKTGKKRMRQERF